MWIGIAVADVTGHGRGAAIIASVARAYISAMHAAALAFVGDAAQQDDLTVVIVKRNRRIDC